LRRAARIDQNQPEIVAKARSLGADWLHTHQLGRGFPDGFIGLNNLYFACEIKGEKGKLTEAQERLFAGLKSRPRIVRSAEDVEAAVEALERYHAAIRRAL
jgi:hypothetical protein